VPARRAVSVSAAALAEEEFGLVAGLGLLRPKRLVVQRRPVERGEVLALVEVHEVGGGEEEAGVAELHSSS